MSNKRPNITDIANTLVNEMNHLKKSNEEVKVMPKLIGEALTKWVNSKVQIEKQPLIDLNNDIVQTQRQYKEFLDDQIKELKAVQEDFVLTTNRATQKMSKATEYRMPLGVWIWLFITSVISLVAILEWVDLVKYAK